MKSQKSLDEIVKKKEAAEKELLSIPGVTGVDVGYKYVNGKRTDEVAIRVHVQKKKNLKDIPAKERIAAEIDGVKTDVLEREYFAQAGAAAEAAPAADTHKYSPVLGGISIGPDRAVNGNVYAGTLGGIVFDNTTGQPYILSNFHVMCIDTGWKPGDQIDQPSLIDTGTHADGIGGVVRSKLDTSVDSAVASISGRPYNCAIVDIGNVNGTAQATLGTHARKRGRTTLLTYGTVEGVAGTVIINYGSGIGTITLTNQINIVPDTTKSKLFSDHGDSGSFIVDDSNNVFGLLFGGSTDGSTVANPIAAVESALNIKVGTAAQSAQSIFSHPKFWDKDPKEYLEGPRKWFKEFKEKDKDVIEGGWGSSGGIDPSLSTVATPDLKIRRVKEESGKENEKENNKDGKDGTKDGKELGQKEGKEKEKESYKDKETAKDNTDKAHKDTIDNKLVRDEHHGPKRFGKSESGKELDESFKAKLFENKQIGGPEGKPLKDGKDGKDKEKEGKDGKDTKESKEFKVEAAEHWPVKYPDHTATGGEGIKPAKDSWGEHKPYTVDVIKHHHKEAKEFTKEHFNEATQIQAAGYNTSFKAEKDIHKYFEKHYYEVVKDYAKESIETGGSGGNTVKEFATRQQIKFEPDRVKFWVENSPKRDLKDSKEIYKETAFEKPPYSETLSVHPDEIIKAHKDTSGETVVPNKGYGSKETGTTGGGSSDAGGGGRVIPGPYTKTHTDFNYSLGYNPNLHKSRPEEFAAMHLPKAHKDKDYKEVIKDHKDKEKEHKEYKEYDEYYQAAKPELYKFQDHIHKAATHEKSQIKDGDYLARSEQPEYKYKTHKDHYEKAWKDKDKEHKEYYEYYGSSRPTTEKVVENGPIPKASIDTKFIDVPHKDWIKDINDNEERKRIKDVVDQIHYVPGFNSNPGPLTGFEGRLAQIEQQLGQISVFIGQNLRPDLSQGALRSEPDAKNLKAQSDKLQQDAANAMNNKAVYDTKQGQ